MFSNDCRRWIYQTTFSHHDRIDFYRKLSYLLEQGQLKDSFSDLIDLYSDNGKKPSHPMVFILSDCLQAIHSGYSLSKSLASWIPKDEVSTIASGEATGHLKVAFERTIQLVSAKMRIHEATVEVSIYPLVMLASCALMLNIIANKLVPMMSKIIPLDLWTSKLMVLYYIAYIVTHGGLYLTLACCLLLFSIIYSMPHWTSESRVFFDAFGPWAIYRSCQGAMFLMNIASLLASGIQLKEALLSLSEHASPWLLQRIQATIYGIDMGAENLGLALKNSGYRFPDNESINFLCIISRGRGGESRMIAFAEQWLDHSIKKVVSISNAMRNLGIIITISLLILVITCSAELSSLMNMQH
jgi:type II secretory pathway component PulF